MWVTSWICCGSVHGDDTVTWRLAGGWRWPGNEARWRCWWLTKCRSNDRRHSSVRSWRGWSQGLRCITQLVIHMVDVVMAFLSPSPWLCLFDISSLGVEVRCQLCESTLLAQFCSQAKGWSVECMSQKRHHSQFYAEQPFLHRMNAQNTETTS